MTNNDELALKLKAAAYRVKEFGGIANYSKSVGVETAFRQEATPANILSLLAERDDDKKRIAEQQQHISSLDEAVNMLLAQYDQLASAIGWTTEKALAGEGNQEQYAEAMVKRIAELEAVCAESYQVVGLLADAAGVFETSDAVSKALDNLSAAKLVHGDVLPFVAEARTVSVKLPDRSDEMFWSYTGDFKDEKYQTAVIVALTEAGIKTELEE